MDLSAMMMQMLKEKQNKASASTEQSDTDTSSRLKRMAADLRKFKRIVQSQRAQLEVASEFIHQFADLIGACQECLGQVPECKRCGGTGGPGTHMPDPQLLEWIRPALDRAAETAPAAEQSQH